jgi:chaperonin GroES
VVNIRYLILTSWSIRGVWLRRAPFREALRMTPKTATSVTVTPLADRVVLKALSDSEQMRGGLYIPDTAKEKPQQGEIIAVGPGRFEKDKRVPMDVKVGDKVLYGKYSGTEVTIDGEQLLILRESDVLAVIG